jgi:hypothetical protein
MSFLVLVALAVVLAAALLTLLLVLLLLGGLVGGLVFSRIPWLRPAAPFLLLVPTCTAIGAGAGSWGLFLLACAHWEDVAVPAWAVGYPLGGAIGFAIGLTLAILVARGSRSGSSRSRGSILGRLGASLATPSRPAGTPSGRGEDGRHY